MLWLTAGSKLKCYSYYCPPGGADVPVRNFLPFRSPAVFDPMKTNLKFKQLKTPNSWNCMEGESKVIFWHCGWYQLIPWFVLPTISFVDTLISHDIKTTQLKRKTLLVFLQCIILLGRAATWHSHRWSLDTFHQYKHFCRAVMHPVLKQRPTQTSHRPQMIYC